MTNKNPTGTIRQRRRRQREKEWLESQGWKSWEALHTTLMAGKARLMPLASNRENTSSMNSGDFPATYIDSTGTSSEPFRQ